MPNDVPSPCHELASFAVEVQKDLIFIIAFFVHMLIQY